MAIIIPSKNIYKKENDKIANNNSITSVEQTTNEIRIEYGNVLSRTLNFNFYDFSTDTPTALYNDKKNTEGFDFITSNGTDGSIEVSARLLLKIDKKTIVRTFNSQNGLALIEPSIRSKHTYYLRKKDESTNEYYFEPKEAPLIDLYPLIVSYDKKTNILEMDITRTIKFSSGDTYLASETFELVGDYIVTDISSIKYGNGEKVFFSFHSL